VKQPDLTEAEQRFLKTTTAVYAEWTAKPRSQERSGALSAIGSVWNRLGWTMRAQDELERLAKERR
jgi:hypothetical protein